jgi:hypothetical protein
MQITTAGTLNFVSSAMNSRFFQQAEDMMTNLLEILKIQCSDEDSSQRVYGHVFDLKQNMPAL